MHVKKRRRSGLRRGFLACIIGEIAKSRCVTYFSTVPKCSKTEQGRFKTNVDNIFVVGDMHTGQSLVSKAIRQGRECAREVDKSLMGI